MTHRGPFQPLLFCDSVILWNCSSFQDGRLVMCSRTVQAFRWTIMKWAGEQLLVPPLPTHAGFFLMFSSWTYEVPGVYDVPYFERRLVMNIWGNSTEYLLIFIIAKQYDSSNSWRTRPASSFVCSWKEWRLQNSRWRVSLALSYCNSFPNYHDLFNLIFR